MRSLLTRPRKHLVCIGASMKSEIGFVESKLGKDQIMDMEEVYLRQITDHLKRQTELQEANNELLRELLQKLGN